MTLGREDARTLELFLLRRKSLPRCLVFMGEKTPMFDGFTMASS